MYIIEVSPLSAIPRNQSQILSYFFESSIPTGSVVKIPLRKKSVKAIVINSKPLKSLKFHLKKEVDFEIKNIQSVISEKPVLNKAQMEMAHWISSFYYAPMGLTLKNILPPFFDKKTYKFETKEPKQNTNKEKEIFISTKNFEDHYKDYKSLIEKYLKNGQVLLLVPERKSGEYFFKKYSELSPIFVNSQMTNKERLNLWNEVQANDKSFIIGTRSALFLPYSNLKLIIVDDEPNEIYYSDMTPRYHAPTLAKKMSSIYKADILINASLPRLNYFQNFKKANQINELDKKIEVADMVSDLRLANFSLFSRQLQEKIIETNQSNQKGIIFVGRKGYAPSLLCKNCGYLYKCKNCDASMVVHDSGSSKKMICHHCRQEDQIPQICPKCNSYKIKPYGIGTGRALEEIEKLFKKKKIELPQLFRFDSDISESQEKSDEIIDKFLKSDSGILLTTQKILSYKYDIRSPYIGIINADALSTFTDFRTEERLAQTIFNLSKMTDGLIIQTYNPKEFAINALSSGKISEFLDKEFEIRKKFSYPPFSNFVRLTFAHPDPRKASYEAKVIFSKLEQVIKMNNLENIKIYPPIKAPIYKEKNRYRWNIFFRENIEEEKEEGRRSIFGILRYVPSNWVISINPVNF